MLHNKQLNKYWSISDIKKNYVNEIKNYHPVSILSVVSKVLEKEIHEQFSAYLEENNMISDFQFGFRKNKLTELATIKLVEEIRQSIDSGGIVGACFLDLSKAFGTMSHAKLVSKLTSYGVNGIELEWFTDFIFF